jgi:hypothetical protein
MEFALMIYHTPEEFAMRTKDCNGPHLGTWRAYYKALVGPASTSAAMHWNCPRLEQWCVFWGGANATATMYGDRSLPRI